MGLGLGLGVRRRVGERGDLDQHAHVRVDPQGLARGQLDCGREWPIRLAAARCGAARHPEQWKEPAAVERASRHLVRVRARARV